ncbi:hypothetical protein Pla52o_45250 [Novipirellula galeiformis]|uniref:Uncharacterized protein n=2 Tax=Novipirellula galeiformis TaxID=2528004 RepID=A0A5C6CB74_9BACT|nr:hypothetical protein Pla52o_45250 [Novipirellula galeiformis]
MQATGTAEIILDREPMQYDLARSNRRLKDGVVKKSERQAYLVESFEETLFKLGQVRD